MSKYAILDENNKVLNIIIAESLNIAKEVTKTELVVEIDDQNKTAYIGGVYLGKGKFELPEYAKSENLTLEQITARRLERVANGEFKPE
jgi:hypothetical protein